MKSRTIPVCFLSLGVLLLWQSNPAFAVPTHEAEPGPQVSAPTPDVDTLQWRTLTSAEGRFSILVPSPPISRSLTLSSVPEVLQQFICRVNGETYIIQYADRNPKRIQILGAEEMLSLSDDAGVHASHGSLISKRHLTLGGYPGHEVVIKRLSGNKEIQHTYLVGNRLYTLITMQLSTQTEAGPTGASKFLDSFTLLPAKLPDTKLPDTKLPDVKR